MTSNIKQFITF